MKKINAIRGQRSFFVFKGTLLFCHIMKFNLVPIFFSLFFYQVLDLIKEVSEDKDDLDDVVGEVNGEGNTSDISAGYHSDSESCVMTSGNSPFISKEARYNFLSRSGRIINFFSREIASEKVIDRVGSSAGGKNAQSFSKTEIRLNLGKWRPEAKYLCPSDEIYLLL